VNAIAAEPISHNKYLQFQSTITSFEESLYKHAHETVTNIILRMLYRNGCNAAVSEHYSTLSIIIL
jgi:hypothetical protein